MAEIEADPAYDSTVSDMCTSGSSLNVAKAEIVYDLGPSPTSTSPIATSSSIGSLVAADGTTLAAASATHTIYTSYWSQSETGVGWKVEHHGRIYFDKAGHVWAMTSSYGYRGSHFCDVVYAYGFSVSYPSTGCSEELRQDLWGAGGHPITEWDHYMLTAFVKGFPLSHTYTMHMNAYADGARYYHW